MLRENEVSFIFIRERLQVLGWEQMEGSIHEFQNGRQKSGISTKDYSVFPSSSLGCELPGHLAPWVSLRGSDSHHLSPEEVVCVISVVSSSSSLRDQGLPDAQQKTCHVAMAKDYAVRLSSLSAGRRDLG